MNSIDTSKKAPGVTLQEHDRSNYDYARSFNNPIALIFGFSPMGSILEPKYFDNIRDMTNEFGKPENSLEKYFLNAGARVIQSGGTAMMTRLPYDNFQNNNVKYVRYAVNNPIHRQFVYSSSENEVMYRRIDNEGINALNALHELDNTINGYSRITLASKTVESMTLEQFNEVTMDATDLENDSIYIFDVKKQQLGTNPLLLNDEVEYIGVVPLIVTASTALYVQEKLKNNEEHDKLFNLLSIPIEYDGQGNVLSIDADGIVTDVPWKEEKYDNDLQDILKRILTSFDQTLDFHHKGNFYDKKSVGDVAAQTFPLIRYADPNKLERKHFDQIGIVVMEMVFNQETEKVEFILRESHVGYISNIDSEHPALEISVNNTSKYIRIVRKTRPSPYRDYYHISNQPLVIFGMRKEETLKKINYMKSIMEPIQYMLDSQYTDVDSCIIDVIVDAGITSVAHIAWEKYLDEENYGKNAAFFYNPTQEDVTPTLERIEHCSTAWNKLVNLFTKFIEYRRGECLYLADGPRCLNISRNSPFQYHYAIPNMDIFNSYLKYFSEVSSSYGAKFWNWVLARDYYTGLSIWMPPSIIAVQLLGQSEHISFPWYSFAGFNRGIAPQSYAVSLKTKPYTDENDFLYLNHWNYFTENINVGVVLEGNKTMQFNKTALDRINVRRLCNYIKRQVRNISNKYKYEPNTRVNRMQFRDDIENVLVWIQRNAGIEDYQVLCGDSINTNEVIERNELRCKIYIKPIKAIEYIIVDTVVTRQDVVFTESSINPNA